MKSLYNVKQFVPCVRLSVSICDAGKAAGCDVSVMAVSQSLNARVLCPF